MPKIECKLECKLELIKHTLDEKKIKAKVEKIKQKLYCKKICSQITEEGQKQLNLLYTINGYIEYQVTYKRYNYSTHSLDRAIEIFNKF